MLSVKPEVVRWCVGVVGGWGAAGVDIFTLARRMGTSVKMIDQTYGHLITGADVHERELLDAYDEGQAAALGHVLDTEDQVDAA